MDLSASENSPKALKSSSTAWPEGGPMAYYKVRIEAWCDWNPAESDIEEIGENISAGEAICTKREVVAVVDRPQDIEDEEAMALFGGAEGDADESQGQNAKRPRIGSGAFSTLRESVIRLRRYELSSS